MSVTISFSVLFPIFTLSITFSVRTLMMCSSSSSKKVRNIVKSFTLFTVSKALLISNIRRYMVKLLDIIAVSASSFIANTCSVVLLPDLYAAWVLGIYCRALPVILLIICIAIIFLRSERNNIGLKLASGPCFFLLLM